MLRLIERLFPAALHRWVLRRVFALRHRWRMWRKAPVTGCNVVVTDLAGSVLLLRHSYGPDEWHLPGGGLKRGEASEAAARRELIEELGLDRGRLKPLGEVHGEISGSPLTVHLFALAVDQQPVPDRREVVEARFFPLHSLPHPLGRTTDLLLSAWRERRLEQR